MKPKIKMGVGNSHRGVERGYPELSTLPVDKFCAHIPDFSAAVIYFLTKKLQIPGITLST